MRRMRVLLVLTLALALSGVMPAAAVVTSKIESVVFVDANNGYMSGGYLDAGDRVGPVGRRSPRGAGISRGPEEVGAAFEFVSARARAVHAHAGR